MKRLLPAVAGLAGLATLAVATVAVAQSANPITQRQTLLKEMGAASREPGQMLRGEAPFDQAKVRAALTLFAQHARALPALFPDGSFTGETAALPRIAAERAQFNAIFAQLDQQATAAAGTITADNFRPTMGGVLRNCGTCHDTYRRPRS